MRHESRGAELFARSARSSHALSSTILSRMGFWQRQ
jgi:hypothetical protein